MHSLSFLVTLSAVASFSFAHPHDIRHAHLHARSDRERSANDLPGVTVDVNLPSTLSNFFSTPPASTPGPTSSVWGPAPSSRGEPPFHHNQPSSAWSHHRSSSPSSPSTWSTSPPFPSSSSTPQQCDYWLADIKHQGLAAFNPNPESFQVFRNVRDFGAKGDGVTDDAPAINKAISSGGTCGPGACNSTTTAPNVVYFPPGIYLIGSTIIDFYYTQLIGNPNCLPTLKASSNFTISANPYLIDGDPYDKTGALEFGATNIFWRQIRNFVLDMTHVPSFKAVSGIHWPTGQATSISNVIFNMSRGNGTQNQGIVIDAGSGGFVTDLVFNGGKNGGNFGNQQFTMKNMTFNNVQTAIYQSYSWGWVYSGITINNSSVGVNMYNGGPQAGAVGSITFIDSEINNTPIGFYTAHTSNSTPATAGSLILENIHLNNVPIAVRGGDNRTALVGTVGSSLIAGWGEGHKYDPNGPTSFEGSIAPVRRPANLLRSDGAYYTRSKPQYEQYALDNFLSARDLGATGNGRTDDTAALQKAILTAQEQQKILFVDHGDYLVTAIIYIPAGSRIIGEAYSVILSSGQFFNDIHNPQPVVQIGHAGECGSIEWSDMIVSTQGQQQGAILFEYNLVAPSTEPAGLWDVHARIGGFAGSDLQVAECPTTPNKNVTSSNLNKDCIAGFMTMHVTEGSTGLYLENVWLWTADHDVKTPLETQITIYNARGLLAESAGPLWLWSTSVEHHTKYQYSFVNAQNVFAGVVQTETPYYEPNPPATAMPYNATYHDPQFSKKTTRYGNVTIPSADAWGMRIVDSSNINVYMAGLYSFFDNQITNCVAPGHGELCQTAILSFEGNNTMNNIYNLNTVGTHNMINQDDQNRAIYSANEDGFIDTIALIQNL